MQKSIFIRPWRSLILMLLLLGLWFRVAYLDRKVYWVDEVATSIRISGYTKTEITQDLLSGKSFFPADLLRYQIPQRGWQQTLQALTKSPEHAPLYFLLARIWVDIFGSSAAAIRSLSVLFSLIALPLMYGLAKDLFQGQAATIALALTAVSPYFVAYAQEARPYSLWVVTLLLSCLALRRAMERGDRVSWVFYALSLAVSFYTSLLSLWVALGQVIWVLFQKLGRLHAQMNSRTNGQTNWQTNWKNFSISMTWAVLAFSPWLWNIMQHWQTLQDNTNWMWIPMNFFAMVAIWLYSIVIVFVDFPVYLPVDGVIISAILIDLVLLASVGFSFYFLCKTSVRSVSLFMFTLVCTTPLCLMMIDLITQGQSSTAPRYLIPAQIGVLLAIAHLLSHKLSRPSWRIFFALLLSMGIISCVVNLEKSPKYQKIRNLHNGAIVAQINQARSPLILSESRNTMDLLSLSHSLAESVEIRVLSQEHLPEPLTCQTVFLFNPSESLRQANVKRIELLYQPPRLIPDEISLSLWKVKPLWKVNPPANSPCPSTPL